MTKPCYNSYIICATPRTGSTLLCRLLTSTGVCGKPNSFFRRTSLATWMERWGLPSREEMDDLEFSRAYLSAAITEGKNGTDMFGLCLMGENIEDAMGFIGAVYPGLPNDKARFKRAFGRPLYIHLAREDKVAQAVSYVKAHNAACGMLHRMGPSWNGFHRTVSRLTILTRSMHSSLRRNTMTGCGSRGSRLIGLIRCA